MAGTAGKMEKVWDNEGVSLGIYISVPFCRTKCSYCNFASDVFSKAVFERYVDRVCADIGNGNQTAEQMGGRFDREVDSISLGGGTPTVLSSAQLRRIFDAVCSRFTVTADRGIAVEWATGTLTAKKLDTLLHFGVDPVSAGVYL